MPMTSRAVRRPLLPLLAGGLLIALAAIAVPLQPAAAVDVQRVVSPGGIEAWLVEDHSVPLVSISLAFEGGSATDPAGKAGLANMVSGLLDEGAGDLDSDAFQRKISDLSVELGFDAGRDGFFGTMRALTRHRDAAFGLLQLALTEPRFDARAVDRIRGQILVGIARRTNDPGSIAGETFWQAVLPGHPYANPVDGTAQSVAALTADDLHGFVRDRFARDSLKIGVAGDITAEELAALLDRTFSALPAKGAPVVIPEAMPADAGATIVVRQNVPQSTILFGQRGLKRDDPDYYTAYVLNHLLGGGAFSSQLYTEVREKRGLAYSAYSYLNPLDHTALWMGGAATANPRVGESLGVIRDVWAGMQAAPVDTAALDDAKRNITGSFALRLTSSKAIARMLVGMQRESLGIDYLDRRNELIDAVTAEAVARVARRVLDPAGLTFVVVGEPEGVESKPGAERG
jgi:zinc protease